MNPLSRKLPCIDIILGRSSQRNSVPNATSSLKVSRGISPFLADNPITSRLNTEAANGNDRLEYPDGDSNSESSETTMNDPLISAVREGNLEIVKELLDTSGLSPRSIKGLSEYDGNPVGLTSLRYETVLHLASNYDREKIVEILLNYGADIDAKAANGETALHVSSRRACVNAVKTLLERGADINVTCKGGRTPLYRLCSTNTKIFDRLFELHVIKMQASNRYVSEINLQRIVKNGDDTSRLRNDCDSEIEAMKKEIFCGAISFCHVLTEDRNKMAAYVRMVDARALRSDRYERKFPIYSGWINTNLRRGQRRKDLLDRAVDCLDEFIDHRLPDVLTMEICRYVDDDDLRNLIDARDREKSVPRSSRECDS